MEKFKGKKKESNSEVSGLIREREGKYYLFELQLHGFNRPTKPHPIGEKFITVKLLIN